MQIVSWGDNLHETSKPISEKNKIFFFKMSAAELSQTVVKVNFS